MNNMIPSKEIWSNGFAGTPKLNRFMSESQVIIWNEKLVRRVTRLKNKVTKLQNDSTLEYIDICFLYWLEKLSSD